MNRYRALQLFPAGAGSILELTADQAKTRLHNLEILEPPGKDGVGVYRARVPVQFKRGEEFAMDGPVARAHEAFLELVGAVAAKPVGHPTGGSAPAPGPAAAPAPAAKAKAKATAKSKKSKKSKSK